MNPEIFREYDIRGIAGEDITEDDVVLIGKAVGNYLIEKGNKKLSVGETAGQLPLFILIKL